MRQVNNSTAGSLRVVTDILMILLFSGFLLLASNMVFAGDNYQANNNSDNFVYGDSDYIVSADSFQDNGDEMNVQLNLPPQYSGVIDPDSLSSGSSAQ